MNHNGYSASADGSAATLPETLDGRPVGTQLTLDFECAAHAEETGQSGETSRVAAFNVVFELGAEGAS